ncbi:lipopolysaccharide biosynthesis protein [Sphingomicrobium clamense]|uniref:Oligosaccharide flippase family protein n=1 Tax=Sphingomicrobium clamense TaxID=2851013 RepID=A0ABS6V4K6_9SPHN|nr:oligosaccharide flippase family protein [Sphingomicrobium sp. B8]
MSESLKRAGLNFSKLLSGKAVGAVLSVVYLAIAARELGPAGFGVLALMHGVIQFLGGTVAFSGWQTLVRYGQRPLREGDMAGLRSVFRFTASIEAVLALVAILIAFFFLPYAARAGGWGAEAEAWAPFYAFTILMAARQTPFGLLQLYRKFTWLGIHAAVMPVTRLIGTLVVVWLGLGLPGFLIAWMAAAVFEGVSLWALALWLLHREGAGWPGLGRFRETLQRFPGIGRYAFVSNADYTLVNVTPLAIPLLVGAVLGPAAAGLFTLAARATNALLQPAILIGQSGFEVISDLASRKRWAELKVMLAKGTAYAIGFGLLIAAIFLVSGDTVMAIFGGPEFAAAGGILALVAIARALAMAQPGLAAALAALSHPGTSLAISAGTGLLAIPAMVWAMRTYDLDGAGYVMIGQAVAATALAALATSLILRSKSA